MCVQPALIAAFFFDLNLLRNEEFDARGRQLRIFFSVAVNLVNVLDKVNLGVCEVGEKWDEVLKFLEGQRQLQAQRKLTLALTTELIG